MLSVNNLKIEFFDHELPEVAVEDVDFVLNDGEILGIVGESGSGKSVSAYSIMQILADNGRIKSGHIYYKGEDLTTWDENQTVSYRGSDTACRPAVYAAACGVLLGGQSL